jgi:exopolysaccharide biosynthesis polyprenyl glycosylphosphotransferase
MTSAHVRGMRSRRETTGPRARFPRDARTGARVRRQTTDVSPPAQRSRPEGSARVTTPIGSASEAAIARSVRAASAPEAEGRFRPWILDRLPLLLLLADLVAISIAVVAVAAPQLLGQLLALGAIAVFQARHLYRPRVTLAISDDLVALVGGIVLGAVFGLPAYRAAGGEWSWHQAFTLTLVAVTTVVVVRAGVYAGIRAARRRGWVTHRTIIVGTDDTAARLAAALEAYPDHGLEVVGFVGKADAETPEHVRRAILARDSSSLPVLARQHQAGVVLLAISGSDCDDVLESLRLWGPPGRLTIFLVPPLFHMLHGGATDRVRDIALLPLRVSVGRRVAWRVKALLDAVVAGLMLLVLAPALLMIAAAVRWETGPGVIFRQTRVGLGGQPFTLYKFRSLRPASETESAKSWSVAGDDRLGPVGRFIRRSSLDELPQLVNVVKGDMSLVGPRPERPFFVEQFGDEYAGYALRHRVRPGLTGWAAVNGLRGDTSIQERAHFDNVYIDSWSLQLDAKILAMTAMSVVKGTGA